MSFSRASFLKTLPDVVVPQLPLPLRSIKVRQPWNWLIQLYYGDPLLHYEVVGALHRPGLELGLHFESRDQALNRHLLNGFRRHLFEIRDALGESIEAEMWDKGWTKVYEVYPEKELTADYQAEVGGRLAQIITCLQPILGSVIGNW
ncbi:MAG: hypothetical protein AB1791_10570 [Chloroflexota bacterium]